MIITDVVRMDVTDEEIEWAKAEQIEFDKQKTYNKIVCYNNWTGPLGELKFDQFLTKLNIPHEWIKFTKRGWNEPDFIINGKKWDVKTSKHTDKFFIPTSNTPEKYDFYCFITFVPNEKVIFIQGFIDGQKATASHSENILGKPARIIQRYRLRPIKEII